MHGAQSHTSDNHANIHTSSDMQLCCIMALVSEKVPPSWHLSQSEILHSFNEKDSDQNQRLGRKLVRRRRPVKWSVRRRKRSVGEKDALYWQIPIRDAGYTVLLSRCGRVSYTLSLCFRTVSLEILAQSHMTWFASEHEDQNAHTLQSFARVFFWGRYNYRSQPIHCSVHPQQHTVECKCLIAL